MLLVGQRQKPGPTGGQDKKEGGIVALHMKSHEILKTYNDLNEMILLTPEERVDKNLDPKVDEVMTKMADVVLQEIETKHKAAYLVAKVMDFYGIKTRSSVFVHDSIPLIDESETPHRPQVRACGTTTKITKNGTC